MPQPVDFQLGYDASIQVSAGHWVVLVSEGRLALKNNQILHLSEELPANTRDIVHIGYWRNVPCFLSLHQDELPPQFETASLRACLEIVSSDEYSLASRALQLGHWLYKHRYCGACGNKNTLSTAECMLLCPNCEETYYPVIAPCVIGLIQRGQQCLLAQNVRYKNDMYSVLAGFIEAGESAEEAFRREVMEEVGIEIKNIRYFDSQVWPFPSQLMLGFIADYHRGEIQVDGVEIVRADWFDIESLPNIPPAQTLSGRLIDHFVRSVSR